MRVSKELIEQHGLGTGNRPFIFFIMLKRDNPRGFIYRENIKNIPTEHGKAQSTINRYLRYLKYHELIKVDGKGNLQLKNIQTEGMRNSFLRTRIKFNQNDTNESIETKICGLVVRERMKQCEFISNLKEDSVKMHTKGYRLQHFKSVKTLKKIQKKYPKLFPFEKNPNRPNTTQLTDYNTKLTLSDATVAKMLCMSEKTYNRTIKKQFIKHRVLNWESRLIQLPFSAFLHEYDPMYSFSHKGFAYCSETEYSFRGFPKMEVVIDTVDSNDIRIIPLKDYPNKENSIGDFREKFSRA